MSQAMFPALPTEIIMVKIAASAINVSNTGACSYGVWHPDTCWLAIQHFLQGIPSFNVPSESQMMSSEVETRASGV
jgi:hypothetical protein